jgi:geranylgeranyl reductase family protein
VATGRTFDVCIIGAGPAGATCAFYLAARGVRVLLLERERFPRDKLCGDAVCSPAHPHLRRMGVLQEIEAEGLGNWARVGGMFSPNGTSYVGNSTDETRAPLVIAIRRIVLDAKIAQAAVRAGAELVEQYPAGNVEFSAADGMWTIPHRDGTQPAFFARALVAADGAQSRVARSLGMVNTRPDAICSRTYVQADSTNFDADGVLYYPPELLPGYCALFREACGLLNFCCYIIPGGACEPRDLRRMHETILANYGEVRAALGPDARMERMRGASLRLGGIPKSFADHLLIVGDAAGQIDPLTGEGIHYAIEAASMAADVLARALDAGDLTAAFLRAYHERWQDAFGRDFVWSARMARLCARYPALLDGAAALIRKRGADFLRDWGEVMTGARPKSDFLRPTIAFPLLKEMAQQWVS